MKTPLFHRCFQIAGLVLTAVASTAAEAAGITGKSPDVPSVAGSFFRLAGGLALVIALFLGGVWLYRNWQRIALRSGHAPKLNVLEARSLGGKHALYVVAFEDQRFLVAASPAGMTLLSHLPAADPHAKPEAAAPPTDFASALLCSLNRRRRLGNGS